MDMEILLYIMLAALAAACVVLGNMLATARRHVLESDARIATAEESAVRTEQARAEAVAARMEALAALDGERAMREREQMARVKAETELAAERRAVADKVRSQQEMETALREQFRVLAGDVLGEQSRRFKEENRESMDVILKPFKDNIRDFRERVETIYSRQTEQGGELRNELQRLMELNKRITTETTNLTNALKGNSKVQGDWGEVILETILDNSNLIRGVHYDTQLNVKDTEGNNLRPDVVLYLPGGKQIVIDSKVSLTAYVNLVAAETDAERKAAAAAHVASVRQHVNELGRKEYQRLMQSPDFVIMFVPNEPAFLAALQADPSIWGDAYEKKVIVSSPTNLFALLKLVDDLWRRDDQSRNRENIIKYGVALYEQLVAFTSALEGVGQSLEQARTKYDEAYKRLHTGKNNIVRTGERLRKLGLPTAKRQSQRLLDETDGADDDAAELPNAKNSDEDEA